MCRLTPAYDGVSSSEQLKPFQDLVGRFFLASERNADECQIVGHHGGHSPAVIHIVEGREELFREDAERHMSRARPFSCLSKLVAGSVEAAPLVCAGITTCNALRNAGLRSGDTVAVQGIGCLGHLGIQFARHMGFRVVALGRGADKEPLARQLGAHIYIDTGGEDGAAALLKLGGADTILATAPSVSAIGSLLGGLAVRGKLLVVGVAGDPIPVGTVPPIFGGRSIHGSLTGSAIDNQDTLDFSVLQNIRPMIETMPLDQAPEAYKRMMDGKARFRMVLTMA